MTKQELIDKLNRLGGLLDEARADLAGLDDKLADMERIWNSFPEETDEIDNDEEDEIKEPE